MEDPAAIKLAADIKACQVLSFNPTVTSGDFDPNFVWGSATSAYQIEGAAMEGGRGLSVWDVFCLRYPDRILDGTNGNKATNSYYKMKEDVQLMKKMGLKAYRFSFSWSRILPGGKLSTGINQEGVDFYNSLINELLANEIEPFVTLWHWDTPNTLEEDYMGFLSQKVVCDFMRYAEFCFWEFGDRVKHWITLNEPWSYAAGGYVWGTYAPGRGGNTQQITAALLSGNNLGEASPVSPIQSRDIATGGQSVLHCLDCYSNNVGNPGTEPYIVAHNLLLCHGIAVKLYREKFQAKQKGKIGITLVTEWYEPLDPNSKEDQEAAVRGVDFILGWYLEPITRGEYPASMRRNVGDRLPKFTEEQSKLLKGSFDFIGLNYYTSKYATFAEPEGDPSYLTDSHIHEQAEDLNGNLIGPPGGSPWFYVYAPGFYKLLMYTKATYGDFEIYITENVLGGGLVGYTEASKHCNTVAHARMDIERIEYYNDHLEKLRDAIRDGVNVKGYFAWSLMDNFEWREGYTVRFGMFYVDFKNGVFTRYPKQSVLWFMDFLRSRDKKEYAATKKRIASTGTEDEHEALKKSKIRTT